MTQPLILTYNNQTVPADLVDPRLVRSVIISLFTWRRANPDDVLPSDQRMGWWGDWFSGNHIIGSRLWLLLRSTLTDESLNQAREYALEALQWLVDDGVASAVDVIAERGDLNRLDLGITITRISGESVNLRFEDVWSFAHV